MAPRGTEETARMGRPKLDPKERRDDHLPNVRVTANERAELERRAEEAGISLTEFCRRAILNRRIAPRRSSIADSMLVELNRVGVNLNQIARHMNAGRDLPPDFAITLDELRATLAKVMRDGS